MSDHMPKSTAETIARIKGCACRGTSWNNVALVDDLCLVMMEVLDRLSAFEQREARREKAAEKPQPDRCTCPPDWSSQGKHMLGCPLIAYLNRPPTSKVSPPPQPSQPQPGAGVENPCRSCNNQGRAQTCGCVECGRKMPTSPYPDAALLDAENHVLRMFDRTVPNAIPMQIARDAQIAAAARAKAIDDCLKAAQHSVVELDSGGQTLVNACNAIRRLKDR